MEVMPIDELSRKEADVIAALVEREAHELAKHATDLQEEAVIGPLFMREGKLAQAEWARGRAEYFHGLARRLLAPGLWVRK